VLRDVAGNLDAQVRGSLFAWSCRIIGVESLIKMLEIKENSEQLDLVDRIRTLLVPQESTRLDSIRDPLRALRWKKSDPPLPMVTSLPSAIGTFPVWQAG
jgi:hypothetical protein